MFKWLSRFRKSTGVGLTREELLNDGLELAMDWGENWLAPIQERLHQRHGRLQRGELDELNTECQAAMKFGHETAYELVRAKGKAASQEEFLSLVLAQYPWVTPANGARLFKQSMYFAWKTGGPAGPVNHR